MSIDWDDSYCVNDDEINEQHQLLFQYVNDFLRAETDTAMTHSIIQLFKYTRQHFAYEEALMREVNFPYYEEHLRMHDHLVSRLGVLGDRIADGTINRAEVETFIKDWALGHIPHADAKLAKFLHSGTHVPVAGEG